MNSLIGLCQSHSDVVDPARATALAAVLDIAAPSAGEPLPPFFHQVYFWEAKPPAKLGEDGHPRRGAFLPHLGLPRRMWAGGRLQFPSPFRSGCPAIKQSTITDVAEKTGRSGRLAFATVRHEIFQDNELCIVEEQDLVFREAHDPSAPALTTREAPKDAQPERVFFDPTTLFRYSALTHNGHRIHYDLEYARNVEGYGNLVTHGPLLAQLLMLRAAKRGQISSFSFRATSPLLVTDVATLCQSGQHLWVRNDSGALVMEGTATWD